MSGVTLIEMLITLLLITVMATFALFRTPDLLASHLAGSTLQSLRATINFARHAAVVHRTNVVVCPRGTRGCGARNSWHQGALVFADRDADFEFSKGDLLLNETPALRSGRIYWRAFRSRSFLLFTPRGLTDWQNGHLLYCPADGNPQHARQLVLNVTGRTYPSHDRNGDGVHEDVRGRNLVCP